MMLPSSKEGSFFFWSKIESRHFGDWSSSALPLLLCGLRGEPELSAKASLANLATLVSPASCPCWKPCSVLQLPRYYFLLSVLESHPIHVQLANNLKKVICRSGDSLFCGSMHSRILPLIFQTLWQPQAPTSWSSDDVFLFGFYFPSAAANWKVHSRKSPACLWNSIPVLPLFQKLQHLKFLSSSDFK